MCRASKPTRIPKGWWKKVGLATFLAFYKDSDANEGRVSSYVIWRCVCEYQRGGWKKVGLATFLAFYKDSDDN